MSKAAIANLRKDLEAILDRLSELQVEVGEGSLDPTDGAGSDQTAPDGDPFHARLVAGEHQATLKWLSNDTSLDKREGTVHYELMRRSGTSVTDKVEWAVELTVPADRTIDTTTDTGDIDTLQRDPSSSSTDKVFKITPAEDYRKTIPDNGLPLTVHWKETTTPEPVSVPVTIVVPDDKAELPQGTIRVAGTSGMNKQVTVQSSYDQMFIAIADAKGYWEGWGILTTGHHILYASTDDGTSDPVSVTVGKPGPFYASVVEGGGSDVAYLEHVGGPSGPGPKDEPYGDGTGGTVHYKIYPRSHSETEKVNWKVLLTIPTNQSLDTTKMPVGEYNVTSISGTPAGNIVQITPKNQGRRAIPSTGQELTLYWRYGA